MTDVAWKVWFTTAGFLCECQPALRRSGFGCGLLCLWQALQETIKKSKSLFSFPLRLYPLFFSLSLLSATGMKVVSVLYFVFAVLSLSGSSLLVSLHLYIIYLFYCEALWSYMCYINKNYLLFYCTCGNRLSRFGITHTYSVVFWNKPETTDFWV